MNHKRIYNLLVENAKRRNTGDDKHHILPKSLGGSNDAGNLVLLTYKEHYIAHHLLSKIYKCKEMTYAYHLMHNLRPQRITAKVYENLKKDFKAVVSATHKGKTVSKETRRKLSEFNTGKGDMLTDEGRKRIIESNRLRHGELNGMYNKKHKPESIEQMIKNRSGEKHPAVNGHYITPWGKYLTAGEASKATPYELNHTSLRRWCRQNNDKKIRNQSYLQCKYLNDLGESVVGKTFKEIGFSYETI